MLGKIQRQILNHITVLSALMVQIPNVFFGLLVRSVLGKGSYYELIYLVSMWPNSSVEVEVEGFRCTNGS